jgi:uncharacterized RDD family membrane protein YckC
MSNEPLGAVRGPHSASLVCAACGASIRPGDSYCGGCGRGISIRATDYGGFWIRLIAWLIDVVIILGIGAVIELSVDARFATGLLRFAAVTAYIFGFWLMLGATPGKILFGLRIVMTNGSKLTLKGAILRYLGEYVSIFLFFIGYLFIAFRADKRALHDLIAGTMVIRVR